ncbi:MAG: ABC transporter ATP-binding protein/permease [Lachnospiraceae bacterium]|nr:ABC transporter ATP-binding protein/permease [Lachnospiraceae bacterium]
MAKNATRQDEEQGSKKKSETLIRLFSYLLEYKMTIVLVLLMMAVTTVITLVDPLLIEYAIDKSIASKDFVGLITVLSVAVVLNVIMVILIRVRMYVMAKVSNDVLVKIRKQLYAHIQTLSFDFFDSRPTGKILARVMGDVSALKDVISNTVTILIPDAVTIIAVVAIMLAKNLRLGLAALWTLPLMIGGVLFVQSMAHKGWQVFYKKNSNLNAFIHEDVAGIKIIQSFNAEKETCETFDTLTKEHYEAYVRSVKFGDAFGPVVDICWAGGTIMMFFVGVKLTASGNLTVGTLIAFASYIALFWQPVFNLSNYYNQLVTNISRAERVFEILDTPPDIYDKEGAYELPKIKGEVTFDKVSFGYEDDDEVLNDVSFVAKPGQTIALVGATGAGKTTIVSLVARFYDVDSGRILIDGNDIRDVTLNSLRRQLGIMTQDNFLFTGTVRDNIRYGRLDATDEEIIAAAKAVNAHEFIMKMEKGYDTEIKERGAGLSAGERQLIAFARTMVSDPGILILDEATSSIDTHTELLVQDGIEVLLRNRTSFVIAHRLSTIQKADRIFVIDDGGIKEQGTAEELLTLKGEYYKLYKAQFGFVS